MRRIWFNPIIGYSFLIDGNNYWVRLYEFEYVPQKMAWDSAGNQFTAAVTSLSYTVTAVNRVSEII